jgi:transcriptional regulator with XRE-family HTH domain
MNKKAIGETLRELRGNLSPAMVSENLGISKSALYMYERGERIPRDEVKIKIAKLYGKSVTSIFFNS